MSFWNTDRLVLKQSQERLIEPFDPQFAKQGAYELSLGPEAFITTEPNATKKKLAPGDQLSIPPGQFGLLLTEEVVTVPHDAIAFISVRFTIKRRGLINVSGFHVDPGFSGRLKFAVHNAGSQNIVVSRGERVFMIWFSDMNAATPDPYKGGSAGQKEITSQDVMYMQGEVASPAALKKQIEELQSEYDRRLSVFDEKISTWKQITIAVLTGLIALFLLVLRSFFEVPLAQRKLPSESPNQPVQETNRNVSPATEANGNAANPQTNKQASPHK